MVLALVSALLLSGCVSANDPKTDNAPDSGIVTVSESDSKTVTVSDVDELLAAIAPGVTINMKSGVYDLTKAADYGKSDTGRYYRWESNYLGDDYELRIENVDGLSLICDDAEILTVPRTSNVLVFSNCDKLLLRSLSVGHTVAAEACEGGVVMLEYCDDSVIDGCSLYGCGTIGVHAEKSRNLTVSGTDIHHCSISGLKFTDAEGLSVKDCSIYDCGQAKDYMYAYSAFNFCNASGITIDSCDVHDNYLMHLICGYADNVSFENTTVRDNHMSDVFDFDDNAVFTELTFTGNIVDNWTAAECVGTVTIDGKAYTADDLTAMWGDQLSSAGIGATDAEALTVDHAGTKEVHVTTADQFTAAIASDTTVFIDVPQLDLTTCSDYGKGASEDLEYPEFGDKNYAWGYCFDGSELWIDHVSNFHIVGGEIVTQPRYANVLTFNYCSNVTLENVRLGHTPEQGSCRGGVLELQNSDNFIIEGCDLYGCGIMGIHTYNMQGLHVQNTLIHDCSNGAAMLEDSNDVAFIGCDVVNCPDPHFILNGCTDFSWDGKLMDPNSSFNVNDDVAEPYAEY